MSCQVPTISKDRQLAAWIFSPQKKFCVLFKGNFFNLSCLPASSASSSFPNLVFTHTDKTPSQHSLFEIKQPQLSQSLLIGKKKLEHTRCISPMLGWGTNSPYDPLAKILLGKPMLLVAASTSRARLAHRQPGCWGIFFFCKAEEKSCHTLSPKLYCCMGLFFPRYKISHSPLQNFIRQSKGCPFLCPV